MNFDYIKEAEPSTDDLRQLYDSLYQNLEKAEELYWTKPQRCGMMLRKATEKICRIYNGYYEINFPESATLEEYLCYTGDDDHNAMVSRFLSVVRKEQRDRLEWLRVWGDECVFMEENPDIEVQNDSIYEESAYNNKLKVALSTGETPNIFYSPAIAGLKECARVLIIWRICREEVLRMIFCQVISQKKN